MIRNRPVGAWALALCVGLSACGGGGGSGSAGPALPGTGGGGGTGATGNPPGDLNFTLANAGRVAGYPIWASEALLRVGFVLGQEMAAAGAHVGASASGDCASSGTWARTLDDNDGSRSLSTGDVLTLRFNACSREPLAPSVDGGVRLTLLGVAPNGGFVARLVLAAPGLAIGRSVGATRDVDYRLSGQATLELEDTGTRSTLRVSAETGDEMVFDFPGSGVAADRVSRFRLERAQRWDEARTVIDLRLRYESPELGGGFDVRTPAPVRAWLDMVPEAYAQQGSLEMRGGDGDLVGLTITSTGALSPDFAVTLDQGGNGSVDGRGEGAWGMSDLTRGFLFSDYSAGGRGGTYAYVADEFSLRPPYRNLQGPGIGGAVRVQFTRPPVDTAAWRWRLVDRGRLPFGEDAGAEVPLRVEQQGALFLVQPVQPLRYSRRYVLELQTGVPTPHGQLLRADNGGSIDLRDGTVTGFDTPDYLNPRVYFGGPARQLVAGQALRLIAGPLAADAPAVAYRWVQTGGTPVLIEQDTTPEVLVRLAGPGAGLGLAQLRLSLTLPDGTSESTDYTLRTLHDTSGPWISVLRLPSQGFTRPERIEWGGPAVGSLVASEAGGGLQVAYTDTAGPAGNFADWTLAVGSADGQPLAPGRYVDAWGQTSPARPPGVPLLDFTVAGSSLVPNGSEFEILEIERDAGGQITRLALDYVVRGSGDYTPITGSVRLNSILAPLQP